MSKSKLRLSFDYLRDRPKRITLTKIRDVCYRLAETIDPQKIILFGSQGNGTATAESDLDLLIIVDDENTLAALQQHRRYGQILRLLPHRGFGLDTFVLTHGEVQKLIDENEGEWDLILEILAEEGLAIAPEVSVKSGEQEKWWE